MSHRWLGLALYAEGSADHRFLDELLRRAVEQVLLSGGHAVELKPDAAAGRTTGCSTIGREAKEGLSGATP